MPAVTVSDLTVLPRVSADPQAKVRRVKSVTTAPQGFEGEGFPVRRAFAGVDMADLDPFIHLDQMGEVEYAPGEPKGTPWHPHRGFETVSYGFAGTITHEDSRGNKGVLSAGDVQWMTAGRGIVHSELPVGNEVCHGLQLWVNLPSKLKMCEPAYQDLRDSEIPRASTNGVHVKVIAGESMGVKSSVFTRTLSMFLDFKVDPGASFTQAVPPG